MPYGILKLVNHKNKLYKELMKLKLGTRLNLTTISKSLMYIKNVNQSSEKHLLLHTI